MLLDVGPSMHCVLPEVEKVCSLLAGKKVLLFMTLHFFTFLMYCGCFALILFLLFVQLIYSKYDEVGVILFGTEGMFWISNGFFWAVDVN